MAKCLMAPRLAPPHGETLTCFGTLTLGRAGTRPRPVPQYSMTPKDLAMPPLVHRWRGSSCFTLLGTSHSQAQTPNIYSLWGNTFPFQQVWSLKISKISHLFWNTRLYTLPHYIETWTPLHWLGKGRLSTAGSHQGTSKVQHWLMNKGPPHSGKSTMKARRATCFQNSFGKKVS